MASNASVHSLIMRAAPRLSRRFFTCSQSPRNVGSHSTTKNQPEPSLFKHSVRSRRQTPFLQAFRQPRHASSQARSNRSVHDATGARSSRAPPLAGTRAIFGLGIRSQSTTAGSAGSEGYFTDASSKAVAYWLFGSAASVFGLVVFGGLTRLTESGLSITEWRPVTGSIPPTTPEMWESEFSRYRQSPESQKLNPNMTMSEFQRIYWMEWIHRQWARIVGLTFLAPTAYFVARGKVSKKMAMNLAGINVLIASQGAVGWWMVKSGLKDELFAKDAHPRVSQYRLATHLGLAVTTFTAMLWNGLTVLTERRLLINTPASKALDHFNTLRLSKALRPFRVSLLSVLTLTFITAGSGAIVAGLDAGLIYNEFPYMGKGLHPPPEELWNPFYSRYPEPPRPDLVWRNMAENPSLAQLDHRILATGTFFAIHALYFYARRSSAVKRLLSAGTRKALGTTLILIYVQAALGLGTLLYLVPKSLASAHQAGALALLTSGTVAASGVWMPGRIGAVLRRRIAGAGVKVERAKAGLGSSASSTGSGAKGGDTVGGTGVVNGDGVDAARRFTYQPPRQTSVLSARRSKEQKGPERVRHALKA